MSTNQSLDISLFTKLNLRKFVSLQNVWIKTIIQTLNKLTELFSLILMTTVPPTFSLRNATINYFVSYILVALKV